MTNYSKSDLSKDLAAATGITGKAAAEAVDHLISLIRMAAQQGKSVNLPGFGKFEMKDRPARAGRNPRTGETVEIPASRKLSFKASKAAA